MYEELVVKFRVFSAYLTLFPQYSNINEDDVGWQRAVKKLKVIEL